MDSCPSLPKSARAPPARRGTAGHARRCSAWPRCTDLAQAVLAEHLGHPRRPAEQLPFGRLPVIRRGPRLAPPRRPGRRGVHDHDRAPGVVRNPVGHAAEQELGPLTHAHVAHPTRSTCSSSQVRDLFSSEVLAPGRATRRQSRRVPVQRPQGLHPAVRRARRRARLQPRQPAFRLHQAGGQPRRRRHRQDDGRRDDVAFYRLDDALGTAIRLQQEVTAWCREQDIEPPLVLKVGVHHGPAIAMTANYNLDYLGPHGQPRGPGRRPEPRRQRRSCCATCSARPACQQVPPPNPSPPACAVSTRISTWSG